jgi:hypothetical protein
VPPVLQLRPESGRKPMAAAMVIETARPGGVRHVLTMADRGAWLQQSGYGPASEAPFAAASSVRQAPQTPVNSTV